MSDRGDTHVVVYLADVTDEQIDTLTDRICTVIADMGIACAEEDDAPVYALVGVLARPFPPLDDEGADRFIEEHARFAIPVQREEKS